MWELNAVTAADYVRNLRGIEPGRAIQARELGWGVSNVVIRVDIEGDPPLVLKQSRARLRTKMEWISRIDRIWNEVAALELLGAALGLDTIPRVLFKDRENYAFGMTCAPEDSRVWKELLLLDQVDLELGRETGSLLGSMHEGLKGRPELESGPLADVEVFDQLRVDPFYRTLAKAHGDLKASLDALIESMPTCGEITFTHADFSPKNILVAPDRKITLVDFETAHRGDPAFDVGFFLSHLWLKAVRTGSPNETGLNLVRSAWKGYSAARGGIGASLDRRSALHLAACALARVDGKSPVDYLSEPAKDLVRAKARDFLLRDRGGVSDWIG